MSKRGSGKLSDNFFSKTKGPGWGKRTNTQNNIPLKFKTMYLELKLRVINLINKYLFNCYYRAHKSAGT